MHHPQADVEHVKPSEGARKERITKLSGMGGYMYLFDRHHHRRTSDDGVKVEAEVSEIDLAEQFEETTLSVPSRGGQGACRRETVESTGNAT
jgi:hypothetical protein